MNFINDRELALRFRTNAVPSKERFLYLLLFVVLTTLMCSPSLVSVLYPTSPNKWDTYVDIAVLVITALGTIMCYKTNQSGDDEEFIERYVGISFPVAVQTMLIAIVAGFAVGLLTTAPDDIAYESGVIDFALISLVTVYFYWRLSSSIKLASQ